tara:strand:+ start:1570 stop:3240 length:1671 start_codon:yes stop_codon:yes gene_type:complete
MTKNKNNDNPKKEFSMNMPVFDLKGRCLYGGCTDRYYDAEHDLSLGMGLSGGKEGDNYKGSGQVWGGYSFNPQRGSGRFRGAQEGLAGYLGANIGGNLTFPKEAFKTGDQSNVKVDPFANAVATLGLKGEWKPKNDFIAHKTGYDKSPLRYGAGVYYKHPLMGEQGSSVGAYGNVGRFSLSGGYNTKTGKEFKLGYGIPIRQTGGEKYKGGGVKKYATAGMYNNTVPQALTNSTTSIVGAERNPAVLQQNQANINAVSDNLRAKNENLQSELNEIKTLGQKEIQESSDNVTGQFNAAESLVQKGANTLLGSGPKASEITTEVGKNVGTGTGVGMAGSPLTFDLATGKMAGQTFGGSGTSLTGAFKGAADAFKAQRATNQAIKAGTLLQSSAGTAGKAGMQALGTGLKSFATSGAGLGMIGTLAGKGISKLSDDNDATKSNFGEYSGSILSSAGTGAGIGSLLGPVGTAVGAGVGALYGAGKQFFGTRAAKRKQEELDAKQRTKQLEYNAQLEDQMGTQLAGARSGELEQKTYSGYDLGRNVTYAFGGRRMEMPRYQ